MRNRGFTLMEMLVVLLIMCGVAMLATSSVETLDNRVRYNETIATMEKIQSAISDTTKNSAGVTSQVGFLLDMGRAPIKKGTDPQLFLKELMVGDGLPVFAVRPVIVAGTAETIAYGWKGPYLKLRPGQTGITDGWGNPFALTFAADGQLQSLTSLGADNKVGELATDPYTKDIQIVLPLGNDISGTLTAPTTSLPTLAIYEMNYVTGVPKQPVIYQFKAADVAGTKHAFRFTNSAPGTKWVVAVQGEKSARKKIVVPIGGLTNVNLTITAPSDDDDDDDEESDGSGSGSGS